jgi:hypothetical protein
VPKKNSRQRLRRSAKKRIPVVNTHGFKICHYNLEICWVSFYLDDVVWCFILIQTKLKWWTFKIYSGRNSYWILAYSKRIHSSHILILSLCTCLD